MSVKSVVLLNRSSTLEKILQSCSSINELVSAIPSSFRASLGQILHDQYRNAQKLSNAQATLVSFDKHKSTKTFPLAIETMIKRPNIQFSKEYHAAVGTDSIDETLNTLTNDNRTSALDVFITLKKKEVAELHKALVFSEHKWNSEVYRVVSQMADLLSLGDKVEYKPATLEFGFHSSISTSEFVLNTTLVYKLGLKWWSKSYALAFSVMEKVTTQRLSKMTLKDNADKMVIDSGSSKTTQQIIAEELKKALKDLKLGNAPGKETKKKVTKPKKKGGKKPNAKKANSKAKGKKNGKK